MSSYPYPATEPSYAGTASGVDPTAVMGRRVGAWLVDSVIVLAPAVVLFTNDLEYIEERDLDQSSSDYCQEFMDRESGVCFDAGDRVYFSDGVPVSPWLVAVGLAILINVIIQGLRGWTPGKALFGIRTVAEDGGWPGIGRAIIRWILLIVDELCAGLVGLIVALSSKGHRRVGDMAAKTFVVGKEYAGRPIAVPGMTPSHPAYPGYPGGPGAPGGPGVPGGGWGGPYGTTPGEPPATWAPPPAWGPTPGETTPQTSGPPAGGAAADEWSVPGGGEASAEPPAETGAGAGGTADESYREAAAAEARPPGYNPQWDPARGTYIVWSPERGQWLGWDEAAQEWKAL